MITVNRTVVATTYNPATDAQNVIKALEKAKTLKTQLRVFFVNEDHYVLGDLQRREAVANGLRKLGKTSYPVHTIIERGMALDDTGLPNFYQEQSMMGASFRQRNADVVDQMLQVLTEAHVLPDFVILFGENHELNAGGLDATNAIQPMLMDGLNRLVRENVALVKTITELQWHSYRSIAACIQDEPENISWKNKVKLNDDSFLGYVEYDTNSKDHNMLLAEKCVVKQKFFVKLRMKELIGSGDWWEVYTTNDSSGSRAVSEARRNLYSGTAQVEIESINPSVIIRAIRKANSPRKPEWKELGKSVQ